MRESALCCPFLLVALFAGCSFGTSNRTKAGCRGDSLELFHLLRLERNCTELMCYRDVERYKHELVAMWALTNSGVSSSIALEYGDRLELVENYRYKKIWLHDLQDSDDGDYTIACTSGISTWKDYVTVSVLIAPEIRCKPMIIREPDTLTAYLEVHGCGKPAVSVYWLQHSSTSVEGNEITLEPGKDIGTVYACINGPAMRCLSDYSSLSDYCSSLDVENHIYSELTGFTTWAKAVLVTTIFGPVLIVTISIILWKNLKRLRKNIQAIHSEGTPMLEKKEAELLEIRTGVGTHSFISAGKNIKDRTLYDTRNVLGTC